MMGRLTMHLRAMKDHIKNLPETKMLKRKNQQQEIEEEDLKIKLWC